MKRRDFTLGALAAASVATASRAQGDSAALVEAAKAEGSLSYWDAVIQPETNDELVAAFRKHWGLPGSFKVNYTLLSTANLITRAEQELSAGRPSTDVVGIAQPSWVFGKVRSGDVLQYESPEYANYKTVFDRGLGEPGYFAFNGGYCFLPMWNADNGNLAIKSWRDVPGVVPAGRMSIGDATNSAAYLGTFVGLRKVLGDDYFRALAKGKPQFLVRSEQIAGRLVDGQDLMAIFGQPTRALQNNDRGASLKFVFPAEGVVLMPQCTFIWKAAPRPNAAKLWIDFILSEPAQIILAKREAMSSGRTGFKSPVPDYAPNIEAMKLVDVAWRDLTETDFEAARKDWRAIFG